MIIYQTLYMKKILLPLLCTIIASAGYAQCDKKIILTSTVTEHLDASDSLQRSNEEKSTIEIGKTEITILPGNEAEQKIAGVIKSHTCNWTVPFKEGKSVIKAEMSDPRGDTKNATITITGKDGKVTLLFELEDMPDRKIRVRIDKFEEVKS